MWTWGYTLLVVFVVSMITSFVVEMRDVWQIVNIYDTIINSVQYFFAAIWIHEWLSSTKEVVQPTIKEQIKSNNFPIEETKDLSILQSYKWVTGTSTTWLQTQERSI